MNLKKVFLGVLVVIALVGISETSVVHAAPFDWRIFFRDSDDLMDTDSQVPSALTNKFAVLGQRYSGEGAASWYYLKSNQFTTQTAPSGYGNNNYEVSIDLSNMNYHDLGTLSDAMDAKVDTSRTVNGHALTSNVTVTKSDITLGNVDNTSDASKPISTATQTTLDLKSRAYEGTTLRSNTFPIFKNATVASGTAVFHLTVDGTSGGAALCPTGIIADSINPIVSDATASFQMSWALSNANKTVTVTTNKLTTANILSGVLGQTAGNGSVVKLSATCY